jgi:hypothetical protein
MKTDSNENIVDTFLDHVRYLKIVHHVPGRIRVKASWDGARQLVKMDSRMDQQGLSEIISRIPGITEYRVNEKALSVIISYDTGILPFDLWEEVGSLGQYPMNREAVRGKLLSIVNEKE